jgi:hypothetical protein
MKNNEENKKTSNKQAAKRTVKSQAKKETGKIKVRLVKTACSSEFRLANKIGSEIFLDKEFAERLIASGKAEQLK